MNYTKWMFASLLLLLLTGSLPKAFAQVPPYVPTSDLLGWWPFTGNANDQSGNGYNGTVSGAILTSDRFSAANRAYRFNSSTAFISTPNIPFNVNNRWSLAYWMKWNVYSNFDVIFDINENQTCTNAPQIWQQGGHMYLSNCGAGGIGPTDMGDSATLMRQWHHFVVVSEGGTTRIYRDGLFFSQGTHPWPTTTNNVLTMGNSANANNVHNHGSKVDLDDIGLWRRALTACEISELYQADSQQRACFWKVTGNNIDSAGNNIFGTLSNHSIRIVSNNNNRGTIGTNGYLGWNTMAPSALLHVDVSAQGATTGIRFQGLPTSTDKEVLSIDGAGNVHKMPYSGGGSNACGTINILPKTTGTNGSMGCSQIFDNGTSVGVNSTAGFNYTSLSGGQLGTTVPPSSGTIRFQVNGVERSLAEIVTSDRNFKENINNIPDAMAIIKQLKGRTFTWNSSAKSTLNADNGLHIGFIAQELAQVIPEVVITDDAGYLGVNYNEIIPLLTEAIKQQQQQIDQLLGQRPANKTNNTDGGYLLQNVPNPFSESTEIRYGLPQGAEKAVIGIYDMNGRELKLFNLSGKTGTIKVQGGEFKPGMYLYSLIIDGKLFDSKKMVLTSE